jgi:hypothetical protein
VRASWRAGGTSRRRLPASGRQPHGSSVTQLGEQTGLFRVDCTQDAEADFTTGGECGAAAAQIIVPPGIHHAGGARGHNALYQAGTEATLAGHAVPVFSDPEFTALPGVPDFILAKRAEALAADRQRAELQRQDEEQRKSSDLSRWLRGSARG